MHLLENQINVSVQKGRKHKSDNDFTVVPVADSFSIFKTIPGSPSYWKSFRNEIFARMEQLGPFHFFFTLSCNEFKWPEIVSAILRELGHSVTFPNEEWDGKSDSISVDGISLTEYMEKNIKSKTAFLKDHFILITRMFDSRLKAFIKHILMNFNVEHYSYRIEFQMRGLPHAHGIFWLQRNQVLKYMNSEGQFDDSLVPELIDQWMSCSTNTGDEELDHLVENVNTHHHTKSCMKRGDGCCR